MEQQLAPMTVTSPSDGRVADPELSFSNLTLKSSLVAGGQMISVISDRMLCYHLILLGFRVSG